MRRVPVPAVLFLAGAAWGLAGCQDGAASNPERETHMGEIRAAADPWPALPPAPSTAAPTPMSAAAPALVAIASAPPAPPEPPPPGIMAPHGGPMGVPPHAMPPGVRPPPPPPHTK
jgi:hypothetical protein